MAYIVRIALVLLIASHSDASALAWSPRHTRIVSIGGGTFKITISLSWHIGMKSGLEAENYIVSEGRNLLFFVYRGDSPDIEMIQRGKKARLVKISSITGKEYTVKNKVTDLVLMPHCGPDKFVWIRVVNFSPKYATAIARAISTFDCAG